MARLFHVKVATLRYYDEIGLLKPQYTDEQTNYRYYSTEQFERLNSIKYLISELSTNYGIDGGIFWGKIGISISASREYLQIRFKETHMDAAYYHKKLFAYMEEYHYKLIEDSIEITLIDYGITNGIDK